MKLHLPKGLRSALLACVAAFAGVGTTITTATLAGGVFAVTMAGQAWAADDVRMSEQAGNTYTLTSDVGAIWLATSPAENVIIVDGGNVYTANRVEGVKGVNNEKWIKDGTGTLKLTTAPGDSRPVTVTVKSGTLDIGYLAGWQGGFAGGEVTVNSGARLKLSCRNALGGANGGTDRGCTSIILNGDSSATAFMEVAEFVELWNTIELNGHAKVEGSGTLSAVVTAPKIVARGDANEISASFKVDGELTMDVAGELNISSAILASSVETYTTTKTGAGTLTLSGGNAATASVLSGTFSVQEGQVENTGVLKLTNLEIASGATMSNSGALTVTDTLTLSSAIQVEKGGSFTLAEGIEIDLSNYKAVGGTYTIFTGEGSYDLSALSNIKVTGVNEEGALTWNIGAGTISYVVEAPMMYNGGTLEWNTTDADFTQGTENVAFSKGGYVMFESGDTVATLQEDITASGITVKESATLNLDLNGHAFTADLVKLEGTMRITAATALDNIGVLEGAGMLVLDYNTHAYLAPFWSDPVIKLIDAGYTGKLQLNSGSHLTINTSGVFEHITVLDGAQLAINCPTSEIYSGDITLSGSANVGGENGALKIGDKRTISGKVTVTSGGAGVTIYGNEKGTITGELLLDGTLTKNGSGTLTCTGNITGGGGVAVNGGRLQIGDSNSTTASLVTGDVSVAGGATLYIFHGGGGSFLTKDGTAANLTMGDDAILYNYDISSESSGHQWGALTVDGTANVQFGTGQGIQKFTNLTAGDGTHSVDVHSDRDDNRQQIHFAQITDFNGSIGYYVSSDGVYVSGSNPGKIYIGTVSQGDQKALTISGGATTSAFAKTGEGSLTIDKLVVSDGGKLTVNYGGTLSIGTLTLGNNATLAYTSATESVLSLGADLFTNKAITLDVSALDQLALSGGLTTGISGDVDSSIFTLTKGADLADIDVTWVKDETNNVWKLTCVAPSDHSVWRWNTPGDSGIWTDGADDSDFWTDGEGGALAGQKVEFAAAGLGEGASTTVTISGNVTPAEVTVDAAEDKSYIFTGDGAIVSGSLTKTGAGTLEIQTANTSTDTLTVEAGTLKFSGTTAAWAGAVDAANATVEVAKDGVASLGGAATIGTLDSAGTLKTNGNAIGITTVTNGGTLNAGSGAVTLGSNATFTGLTAGKVDAGSNTLTLTGDSSITNIAATSVGETGDGSAKLVVSGGVTRLQETGQWKNLETLSLSSESRLEAKGSLKVDGDITKVDAVGTLNANTQAGLDVEYCIRVGGSATIAGDVLSGSDITIAKDATVSGSMTTSGEYGKYVSIGGEAKVDGNVKTVSYVEIGGLATVGGSLNAGTYVTLSAGGTIGNETNKTGDLTANGTLTLGGSLSVGGKVSGVTRINVQDAALPAWKTDDVSTQAPILKANAFEGSALTMAFTSIQSVLDLAIVPGQAATPGTYTLLTTTEAMGALTLALEAPKEAGIAVLEDGDGTIVYNAVLYQLVQGADKLSVMLTATYVGNNWESTDGTWGSSDSWSADTIPAADASVVFNGNNANGITNDVTISGKAEAASMTINTAETTNGHTDYSFTGTSAETDTIAVQALTLQSGTAEFSKVSVGTDAAALQGVEVLGASGLTIAADAALYASAMQVDENASFTNNGSTTISGALQATTVTNANALSIGTGSEIATITGKGKLTITGDAQVGTLDGAAALETEANAVVTVGEMSSLISLTIGEDSTVTIPESVTFALQTTPLELKELQSSGSFIATSTDVVLSAPTTNGGTVNVKSLDLTAASGSTFTSVTTNALTLDVSALATVTDGLLKTNALAAGAAGSLTLTLDGLLDDNGALTTVGESLTASDQPYTLVAGARLADDFAFTLSNTGLQQAFALKNLYALVAVENGNIVLRVTEDDPRYWTGGDGFGATGNHWAGNPNNNNGQVLDLANITTYQALDTVDVVSIDAATKIDLTGADLSTATDAAAGLVIRELTGAESLQITGDAAAEDLVTFSNTAAAGSTYTGEMTLTDVTAKVVTDAASAGLTVGNVALNGDAALEVAGTLTAGDVTLNGADAILNAVAGTTTVKSISGTTGTIAGTVTVNGTGGNYSGAYNAATVVLAKDASQTLAPKAGLSLKSTGAANATLVYTGNAAMDTLEVADTSIRLESDGSSTLTVAAGSQMTGGSLDFDVSAQKVAANIENGGTYVVTENLDVDATTSVVAHAKGTVSTFDVTGVTDGLTLFELAGATGLTKEQLTLDGDFFKRYFENVQVEDGVVKADLVTDYYTSQLAVSENGAAGMQMLDTAVLQVNPQSGDLAAVISALDSHVQTKDAAAADKLAAAVAGSGVASLGMALTGDLERQLKAIRNRTTTMGVDPSVVNENMPYFNAWINAEGDHRSMDEDGTMAGYTLTSWGGTVGFDMDVNPTLTWGIALTAMYADFSAESSEVVDGDVHTYYVSTFARATAGAWVHTFVVTAGKSWTDVNRTVNYGGGSYTTNGDADGFSIGALYEVARTFALNEDATACWQPVFNLAYRHVEVDGYTETGSDAGLRVGDQSLDTLTIGLGGRVQAIVGENIYNRTSVFEARALVKFDVGDRESEMDTALIGASAAHSTVKSAEMDAFGVELGAGLTIPMGMDGGSIFMDGSFEFRGCYTSANATLGYRFNF